MNESGEAVLSAGDLFASYQPRIRRYILSMVHDPNEADDLTQDVFLQVHRKLDTVRDPHALVSWLYRIATHVAYDWFRQRSRRPRFEELDPDTPPGPDEASAARLDRALEQAEMSACIRDYIEDLSTEFRQAIFLHDLEGLTNPQIGEMLGVSLDTVKIRVHRARRKLEATLVANCDFARYEDGVFVCEPAPARPAG